MKNILLAVLAICLLSLPAQAGCQLARATVISRAPVVVNTPAVARIVNKAVVVNRAATLVVPTTTTVAVVAEPVFVAAFHPVSIVASSYGASHSPTATPAAIPAPAPASNDTDKILSAVGKIADRLDAQEKRLDALEKSKTPPSKGE